MTRPDIAVVGGGPAWPLSGLARVAGWSACCPIRRRKQQRRRFSGLGGSGHDRSNDRSY